MAADSPFPHVSVIVVLYHSEAVVGGLLESLQGAFGPMDYSLVVVDNSSDGAGARVVASVAPDATILRTGRNLGYAAAINHALVAVDPGDAVLVLNPDVRLEEHAVVELARALRRDGVGIAVPRYATRQGALYHSIRRDPSIPRALADALVGATRAGRWGSLGEIDGRDRSYDSARDVDWATGAVLLFSPECRRVVEPWDASYFLYSEEVDVCQRARDASFAVRFTPEARVTHLKGDSQTRPDLWALLVANRVECYRRRHPGVAARLFAGAVLLRELMRAARGSATSRRACRVLTTPRGRDALIRQLRAGRKTAPMSSDERRAMTTTT